MKSYSRPLLIIFLSSLMLFPVLARAVQIDNPLEADTFDKLIEAIVGIIFKIAIAVAPLMLIIAGFYFVTAAGNPNNINTAKQIIIWTLVGLLVVFSAEGIITLFQEVFK